MSNAIYGALAAAAAPLCSAIGFTLWDMFWSGHAFTLNLFKCTLMSMVFICVAGTIFKLEGRSFNIFSDDGAAWFLVISAFIGITVGDNCWLIAMKTIGARRVILVDAIKPFVAALVAWPVFGERISYLTVLGMIICMAGIVYVSLESADGTDNDTHIASTQSHNATDSSGAENENGDTTENSSRREKEGTDQSCFLWKKIVVAMGKSPCARCKYIRGSKSDEDVTHDKNDLSQECQKLRNEKNTIETLSNNQIEQLSSSLSHSKSDTDEVDSKLILLHKDDTITLNNSDEAAATNPHSLSETTNVISLDSIVKTNHERIALSKNQCCRNSRNCWKSIRCTKRFAVGYTWSALNVILDVAGATLTKQFAVNMNTWEIGAIRFGSAALTLIMVFGVARVLLKTKRIAGRIELVGRPNDNKVKNTHVDRNNHNNNISESLSDLAHAKGKEVWNTVKDEINTITEKCSNNDQVAPYPSHATTNGESKNNINERNPNHQVHTERKEIWNEENNAERCLDNVVLDLHSDDTTDSNNKDEDDHDIASQRKPSRHSQGEAEEGKQIWDDAKNKMTTFTEETDNVCAVAIDLPLNNTTTDDTVRDILWYEWAWMAPASYLWVLLGCIVTTFMCPALQAYALFQIDLATYSTLSALTPIYSLPVVLLIKREITTWRAILGSLVACCGIIPLAFALADTDLSNTTSNVSWNVTTVGQFFE